MRWMKRPPAETGKGGFTLIEVVVSIALIALISTGFMTMAAGSASLLSKEYEMDRMSYRLSERAAAGGGEISGGGVTVHFRLDVEPYGDSYTVNEAEELFVEYTVGGREDEAPGWITFYRHSRAALTRD